jgi:hypothetical protein
MKILFKTHVCDDHYIVVLAKDEAQARMMICDKVKENIEARIGIKNTAKLHFFEKGFIVTPVLTKEDLPEYYTNRRCGMSFQNCSQIIDSYDKDKINKYIKVLEEKKKVLAIREQAKRLDQIIKQNRINPINLDSLINNGLDKDVVEYWKTNMFMLSGRLLYTDLNSNDIYVNVDMGNNTIWMLLPFEILDRDYHMRNNGYVSALTNCHMVSNQTSIINRFHRYLPDKTVVISEQERLSAEERKIAAVAGFIYQSACIAPNYVNNIEIEDVFEVPDLRAEPLRMMDEPLPDLPAIDFINVEPPHVVPDRIVVNNPENIPAPNPVERVDINPENNIIA